MNLSMTRFNKCNELTNVWSMKLRLNFKQKSILFKKYEFKDLGQNFDITWLRGQ